MAAITISELRPVGFELLNDSESFLNELGTQEVQTLMGGHSGSYGSHSGSYGGWSGHSHDNHYHKHYHKHYQHSHSGGYSGYGGYTAY